MHVGDEDVDVVGGGLDAGQLCVYVARHSTRWGLFVFALAALDLWLSETNEPKAIRYFTPLLILTAAIFVWTTVWSVLTRVFIGLESINEESLDSVRKGFNLPVPVLLRGTRCFLSHLQRIDHRVHRQVGRAAGFFERLIATAAIVDT